MQPEEMLDRLLTERVRRGGVALAPERRQASTDPTLEPLLYAVARLDALRDAAPSAEFAADLERRMLERMGQTATRPTTPSAAQTEIIHPEPRSLRAAGSRGAARIPGRVAWAAVAAALALTIGLGVFTAQAAPGAPLYPVRQFAQHVASQTFPAPTETAQAALARARADLLAYASDVARDDPTSALVALGALRADDAQAAQDAAAISDPGARQAMQQRVAQFRQGSAADLRASLAIFDWRGRAQVTDALRAWGATSLRVTQARLLSNASSAQNPHTSSGSATVNVLISGAGFTPGAEILVNGAAVGAIDSLSPTQIKARLPDSAVVAQTLVVGVQTSDDAVAITSNVIRDDHGAPDHSSASGASDGHSGEGGSTANPAPSPTAPRGTGQN